MEVTIFIESIIIVILFVLLLALLSVQKKKKNHYVGDPIFSDYDRRQIEKFGEQGEKMVAMHLGKLAKKYNGYLYNDICFESPNGLSSNIDHILICKGLVFVIETKNNKGVVYGSINEPIWRVVKEKTNEEKTLKNPVLQNRGHMKGLNQTLNNKLPLKNIIVFPYADISNIEASGCFSIKSMNEYISHTVSNSPRSNKQNEFANEQIKELIATHSIPKAKHIANIKKKYR